MSTFRSWVSWRTRLMRYTAMQRRYLTPVLAALGFINKLVNPQEYYR